MQVLTKIKKSHYNCCEKEKHICQWECICGVFPQPKSCANTHLFLSLSSHNRLDPNSPEKSLYNRIYCPSNRSKQIKVTHTAYTAGTQYMRQSLNEKQCTCLHRQNVIGCEAMYGVLHSNFAAYIVYRRCKPCEFLWFVWTDCWSNKSYYIITSPANTLVQWWRHLIILSHQHRW